MLICYLITLLCSLKDQKKKLDLMELENSVSIISSICLYSRQSTIYNITVDSTDSIVTKLADIIEKDKSLDKFNISGSNLNNIEFARNYKMYVMQHKAAYKKNKIICEDIKRLYMKRSEYVMKNLDFSKLNTVTSLINNIMKSFVSINLRMYTIIKNIKTKTKKGKNLLYYSQNILKKSIKRFNVIIEYLAEKDFISRFVFKTEDSIKKREIIKTKEEFNEIYSSIKKD